MAEVARTSKLIALVGCCAIVLGSCSWTAGDQYFIHWSATRDDVIIREATSWDLNLARKLFYTNNDALAGQMGGFRCHADRDWRSASRCVMKLLHLKVDVPELAAGLWGRATAYDSPVHVDDIHGALGRVAASADDEAKLSDCLTVSFTLVGSNWTERDRSDSNCRVGRHTWE